MARVDIAGGDNAQKWSNAGENVLKTSCKSPTECEINSRDIITDQDQLTARPITHSSRFRTTYRLGGLSAVFTARCTIVSDFYLGEADRRIGYLVS